MFKGRNLPEFGHDKRPRNLYGVNEIAIAIKAKLGEVGEDQVRKRVAIPLELLALGDDLQVLFSRTLGLNVADYVLLAILNAEVRIPSFCFLRLRRYTNVGAPIVLCAVSEKPSECRIEAFLASIALAKDGKQRLQISA